MSTQEHGGRPRSRSILSFGSNKSGGSGPKITKEELTKAAEDKAYKRMTSKANPNVAVDEAEPLAQALEKPTIQSNLRAMQFRDQYGNIITDPDRSNPTRPRLERPLDTIRSFEAAIDGSYNRRYSQIETMSPIQSRPSSFYPGMNGQRYPGENANYGNRMTPSRPESYIEGYAYSNNSARRRSPAPFGPQQHRRGFGPRNNSDPIMYGSNVRSSAFSDQRREPRQQTYDTATQGSGSGGSHGTEPWNTSTNPSSENSSVDKFQQAQFQQPPKPDLSETYGFSGFGGAPQGLEYNQDPTAFGAYANGPDRRPVARNEGPPPPPPPHDYARNQNGMRQPVRGQSLLQKPRASTIDSYGSSHQQRPATEKRKSWLMRRFSKNG